MNDSLIDTLTAEADRDGIHQLAVGAVITNGTGKVLLLRRAADDFMGGLWELPSGKVDPGERLDAALAREVAEETGLDLASITGYLGHFDYVNRRGDRRSRQCNFAITTAAVAPVVLTEHDAYQWCDLNGSLPVSAAVRAILDAVESQVSPV